MSLFDVFFGSTRAEDDADREQRKAEEALAAYDEREAKDLALHVDRCARRWGLVRAGQRQQLIATNRNSRRNFLTLIIGIGVLYFRDVFPAEKLLDFIHSL